MFGVLRLGHRHERDKRITTHLALLSRVYGCKEFHLTVKDSSVTNSLKGVNRRFGDVTKIVENTKPKELVRVWKGTTVHLSMYGDRIEKLDEIDKNENILFIVGAEKVPPWVYNESDYNISIGNQPHSEVSALAIALYRMYGDAPLYADRHGEMTVIPEPRGKNVMTNSAREGI